jgi:hypothetical protein
MRRYETTDLSLGHAQAIELRTDGTAWLTGSVVAEVSREWGVWYLLRVRSQGRKYPGRYVTVRTTEDEPDAPRRPTRRSPAAEELPMNRHRASTASLAAGPKAAVLLGMTLGLVMLLGCSPVRASGPSERVSDAPVCARADASGVLVDAPCRTAGQETR